MSWQIFYSASLLMTVFLVWAYLTARNGQHVKLKVSMIIFFCGYGASLLLRLLGCENLTVILPTFIGLSSATLITIYYKWRKK